MPIDTDHGWLSALPASTSMVDSEYRARNEEKTRSKVAAELFAPKSPGAVLGPPIINANLLAGARHAALAACREDIARGRNALVEHLWGSLMTTLANGLLGVIAWHSPEVCWYVRNERRLRLEGHWSQFRYDHFRTVKEVTLMDAMQLQGVPGWLEMPRQVENVVNAVPPILHREIGTVVGTMVKEREISWLVGDYRLPADEVIPRRPVFDPAIVIGSIVLTGWESAEHRVPGWWQQLDCWRAR
jgi:hypothetical protein